MKYNTSPIQRVKNIALVAHDNKKNDLIEWAQWNKPVLQRHNIFATGTTGRLMEKELEMSITKFQSGPLGGDQQIGSHITEGKIDFLIFFWDPLEPQPHDPDVKALLRIALVWNIPTACNRATADFLISSVLMDRPYNRLIQDFAEYHARPATAQGPDKH
jgi:methylglyoxal synthase